MAAKNNPASLTVSSRQAQTISCVDDRRAAELTRYVSVHQGALLGPRGALA
jgi:hypothetical protein